VLTYRVLAKTSFFEDFFEKNAKNARLNIVQPSAGM
jgi:hypothetical protein